MKASDVGISVDSAVDIARESADIILLEKDLMVLEQGAIEGRRIYANIIKYIKMTGKFQLRQHVLGIGGERVFCRFCRWPRCRSSC